MQYKKLGKSDISVSQIGIGCMSMKSIDSYDNRYLIHQALDSGINYFDTADLYEFGENEKLLGEALKGKRNQVVIATKVGNKWKEDKSGWDWDVSASYIRRAIEDSLIRLQTDYIDLYQIHGGTKEDNFLEVVGTLEDLITEGKIKSYGISSIRPNVFVRFINESNIVSNMMQYSILDTRPSKYLKLFNQHEISILARGAFAQGILLGKKITSYLNLDINEIDAIVKSVKRASELYGISQEAVALSFLLNEMKITAAVVGIRTKEQLKSLVAAANEIQNLTVDFKDVIIPKIDYTLHTE